MLEHSDFLLILQLMCSTKEIINIFTLYVRGTGLTEKIGVCLSQDQLKRNRNYREVWQNLGLANRSAFPEFGLSKFRSFE